MRILTDENIPLITIQALRGLGHDVLDIREADLRGVKDKAIWEMAQDQERLLISTDGDFAQFRNLSHSGVIIVRLRQPNRKKIHERVMRAISSFDSTEWRGLLVNVRDVAQVVWREGRRE